MEKFSSSILRFDPILTPFHVTIDNRYVVCRKNNGIGSLYLASTQVSLKKETITNVVTIDQLLWVDLKIITSSGDSVYLSHFKMTDAKRILNLIHS